MKLIPTKCPNCGASIEIDVTQNTYKCEYCRTTFTDADFKRVEINQTITNKNIDEAEVQKQKTDQMYIKVLGFILACSFIYSLLHYFLGI